MIVKILINTSVKTLNRVYDYKVPAELEEQIEIGKRVSISFGRGAVREEEGIIVKIEDDAPENIVSKTGRKIVLKEINSVLDEVSYLDDSRLKLAKWMSHMYFCNVYDSLKLMLPPGTTSKNSKKNLNYKQDTSVVLNRQVDEVNFDIESGKIKSAKHIQLLRFLIDNDFVLLNDIIDGLDISRAIVNTVEKNGYIRFEKIDIENDLLEELNVERSDSLIPTTEQKYAIDSISKYVDESIFKQVLLFGVTGSGKTEVYLQVINKVLKKGKKVIVLVPEISLTHQTVVRFLSRFGNNIAVLHSKMTVSKRKEEYKRIKDGKVDIIIGARSAIFAPIADLGLVIIDEEHDSSYYSQTTPKYSTKEVASYICNANNAVLLLGSATPEISTFYKAQSGNMELITLTNRPQNAVLPNIELINMKDERATGNSGILSNRLKEEILKNIENGQQTMIFLNRRGYSSYLTCNDCSHVFKCKNCDVAMTYHKTNNLLLCHYCSHVEKNVTRCPKCSSENISQGGIGTQKIEEELRSIYSNISILRMDADTTVARDSHQKILDEFRNKKINVLVGTQMISKGHDIENVTLVGILGTDSLLSMNDYLASEKAFSHISQVSRTSW